MKKAKRSHIIALSGISAGLSIITIVLACYVEPLTISLMVLSGVFLMLPLTQDYWIGSIIGYIVASIISFAIVNINALPFILFFGLYVPIKWILDNKFLKKIKLNNKFIRLSMIWIIKIAFFEVIICACWFLMQAVIADMSIFGQAITYLIVSLGLLPIFILYDILMRTIYVNVQRIIASKVGSKGVAESDNENSFIIDEPTNKQFTPFDRDIKDDNLLVSNESNVSRQQKDNDDNTIVESNGIASPKPNDVDSQKQNTDEGELNNEN